MKKKSEILMRYTAIYLLACIFPACHHTETMILKSPDGKIRTTVRLENGNLSYQIDLEERPVLGPSPLGIITENMDFSSGLFFKGVSPVEKNREKYVMEKGKTSLVDREYISQTFYVGNRDGQRLGILFRTANDGVAYAYRVEGEGKTTVRKELSGFRFSENTTGFLSPLAKAKSGWARTNPSYEDYYRMEIPAGTPSDFGEGWIYPALFHAGDSAWVLISETGVDGNYVATHLADDSQGGLYKVEFPPAGHNLSEEPTTAEIPLPFTTPWRMITIGKDLNTIVRSTMAQDLVKPYYQAKTDYPAGRSTWSWLVYNDTRTTYSDTQEFIDMAATLGFEYCLIDAVWDQQIGRKKTEELARYANRKKVGLILWYNSNGNWNDAPQTPVHRMNTPEARREEMAWMQKCGIKGIKVDFFGGDKQSGMRLYQDILEDANEFGITCNFHGATLPRGWDRMFPNFMTAEAVRGMEFCKFEQENANRQPEHCATLPFIRNVVAPMDFTPVVLNPTLGEKAGAGAIRSTSAGFELALPVILYSPIQHLGIIPDNLNQFPGFVWNYLSDLPTTWDETVLLGGYPGKDVIMGRRKGNTWYIAGINGENKEKNLSFSLPFTQVARTASLLKDKKGKKNEVELIETRVSGNKKAQVQLQPYGGFIYRIIL